VKRTLPVLGTSLAAAGVLLLAWLAWAVFNPAAPPYAYKLVAEGGVERFPELGLKEQPGLSLFKYEVRTEGVESPLAVAHVARRGSEPPVLLDWQNQAAEPVLRVGAEMSELAALAEAVGKHAPASSVVLAWWDTSRQLKLLAGANVVFEENLTLPLIVPEPWRATRPAIEAMERGFWSVAPTPSAEDRFNAYAEALLLEPAAGLARLRELAGPGDAFVVLHLSDAFRLGALRPERFGIGFKDFPGTRQSHGLINSVKSWLRSHGYESYAVQPRGENAVRVYFLTDPASAQTLLARLLPFSTSNPLDLDEPRVVFQHGGYWVYRLPPVAAARD
jgi:hydroxylamine oxidation protein HaoB